MAFDALRVHGLDVRGLPLHRRRYMLEEEVSGANMVFAARRLPDNGLAAWGVVKERGYEGLVAKDIESTYRVMRSFMMLKEPPADTVRLRAFIASCRNKDGGYGVTPGQPSSVSGTYYAGIVLHWLGDR